MDRILVTKVNGKKVKSKPFDFEAMCLINEKHNDENLKGPLTICTDAVEYMFEGIEIARDVTPDVMAQLCILAWNMYVDALSGEPQAVRV